MQVLLTTVYVDIYQWPSLDMTDMTDMTDMKKVIKG